LAAVLMLVLIGLLTIASADVALHGQFHADASHPDTSCPICVLANGQLEVPVATPPAEFAAVSVAWTLPIDFLVAPSFRNFLVHPTRGPPAAISSLS